MRPPPLSLSSPLLFSLSHTRFGKDGSCVGWGFVEKSGRVVIPFTYDYVGRFNSFDKTATVRKARKIALINRRGTLVSQWMPSGRLVVLPVADDIIRIESGFAESEFWEIRRVSTGELIWSD